MSALNVFTWISIAAFCEIVFRALSCAFKSPKSLPDTTEGKGLAADTEKENRKANFENHRRKSRCPFQRRVGRGLAALAEKFKSMYGEKEQNYSNNAQEDPLVKDGLTREDKIVDGGNVKVSSYFDENGKMVFQRETILPPPSISEIKNCSHGSNNPPFFIKPQETTATDNLEKQIDKTFGKIYGIEKELADSQKTFVDEHVNKTFKDIYDMVLPSVF